MAFPAAGISLISGGVLVLVVAFVIACLCCVLNCYMPACTDEDDDVEAMVYSRLDSPPSYEEVFQSYPPPPTYEELYPSDQSGPQPPTYEQLYPPPTYEELYPSFA